jgi:uncharacterized protein YgbK (DUF1537 family)
LPYRIDRHPSMKAHPVTPMHESDLRIHLAAQTSRPIRLVDVRLLDAGIDAVRDHLASTLAPGDCVLLDTLTATHLQTIEHWLDAATQFIVGPSSVESALAQSLAQDRAAPTWTPRARGPVLVLSGSCSPVTASQLAHAREHGFAQIDLAGDHEQVVQDAVRSLSSGRHTLIHTRADGQRPAGSGEGHSRHLADLGRRVMNRVRPARLVVTGGDTSGLIAEALGVESMSMIAPFVRGAPWCRLDAPGSPADGLAAVFKGGQVGPRSILVDATGDTP